MGKTDAAGFPPRQVAQIQAFTDGLAAVETADSQILALSKAADAVTNASSMLSGVTPAGIPASTWKSTTTMVDEVAKALPRIRDEVRSRVVNLEDLDKYASGILAFHETGDMDLRPEVVATLTHLRARFAEVADTILRKSATSKTVLRNGSRKRAGLGFYVDLVCTDCTWAKSRGDRGNLGHQLLAHLRDDHPRVFATVSDADRESALDHVCAAPNASPVLVGCVKVGTGLVA